MEPSGSFPPIQPNPAYEKIDKKSTIPKEVDNRTKYTGEEMLKVLADVYPNLSSEQRQIIDKKVLKLVKELATENDNKNPSNITSQFKKKLGE